MTALLEGWDAALDSPAFFIALTLGAYLGARELWQRANQHPLANPVLLAIIMIGVVLELTDTDYPTYLTGASFIALLLGPATVALGLLLFKERTLIKRAMVPILVSVTVGALAAAASAYWIMDWLGASEELQLSMAPKSATTPVSIALSDTIGGLPALSAVFTILAGILGAVAGPAVLTAVRIRDTRVRGLAVGVASHGIGTARMLHESVTEGAFAGLAMALTAAVTGLTLPLLIHLLS